MLASARKEYALEIIDPAATPYKSFNMSRKRKVLLGTFAGTFLCLFAILALVLVRGLLTTLSQYREMDRQARAKDSATTSLDNGDH